MSQNDDALIRFIDRLGPELLFCIGILVILAYIAVKSIPMIKDIRLEQIKSKNELDKERLELDRQREINVIEQSKKEDERDRARTEVIATQNDILSNLIRSNEAMTVQIASLNSSLLDSKDRSKSLGKTVDDTNKKVTDTNRMVCEMHKAVLQDYRRDQYTKGE